MALDEIRYDDDSIYSSYSATDISSSSSSTDSSYSDVQFSLIDGYLYLQSCGSSPNTDCSNYVAISGNASLGPCCIYYPGETLILNCRGNLTINITTVESNSTNYCFYDPMLENAPMSVNLPVCHSLNQFHEIYEAPFIDPTDDSLALTKLPRCPVNCLCTLSYQTFTSNCPGNKTIDTFIIYPVRLVTVLAADSRQRTGIEPGTFANSHTLQRFAILELQDNLLSNLEPGTFRGLSTLGTLNIGRNRLKRLVDGVFVDLINLTELHVDNSQLETIDQNVFADVINLQVLDLSGNKLGVLPSGVLGQLANLKQLYLNKSFVQFLQPGIFDSNQNLIVLDLSGNNLTRVENGTFAKLNYLEILKLENNKLGHIQRGTFTGLYDLDVLNLHSNELQKLNLGIFDDLFDLTQLYIYNNQLTTLEPGVFRSLGDLKQLTLHMNNIPWVGTRTFEGLTTLTRLGLSNNRIETLESNCFKNLVSLKWLDLSFNNLTALPPDLFSSLVSLETLLLRNNFLYQFNSEAFNKFNNSLSTVDLTSNQLDNLDGNIFKLTPNLTLLMLTENPLKQVLQTTFIHLERGTNVFVSEFSTCCYIEAEDGAQCYPSKPKPPQITCGRLLPNAFLRVCMWILGISARLGNVFVVLWRCLTKTKENGIQSFLISDLAVSDFMMGVYMLIITSTDIYFGPSFPSEADTWRRGSLCQFAGTLSILSSEGSIFIVTLISIDRFIGITNPFSTFWLGRISSKVIITCLWVVAMILAILPTIVSGNPSFYDNSEVCIGFPLTRRNIYNNTQLANRISDEDFDTTNSEYELRSDPSLSVLYGYDYTDYYCTHNHRVKRSKKHMFTTL